MKIEFINLKAQYEAYESEINNAMMHVMKSGHYIMGKEISECEKALAQFCGAPFVFTCANGTDALLLAMMAIDLKAGDEIITTPFTFIAIAEMAALLGVKPVFVDIEADTYNIDVNKIAKAITPKTRAIIPVSLYGQPADMNEINNLALDYSKKNGHKIYVIEDAGQSFGASYQGKRSCNLSELACTSFFPSKPLGCAGDGGAIFTSNEELAKKMESLRIHGQTGRYYHQYIGVNGRCDTLQAALLLVKLKHFSNELEHRQAIAKRYDNQLANLDLVLPFVKPDRVSVYAQYTVRVKNREIVRQNLESKGIPTAVHYPKPLHLQPCFAYLNHQAGDFFVSEQAAAEVLSLPMSAFLTEEEQDYIVMHLKGSV